MDTKEILRQIDRVLEKHKEAKELYQEAKDLYKKGDITYEKWKIYWDQLGEINVIAVETIRRLAPLNSTYLIMSDQLLKKKPDHNDDVFYSLGSILKALRTEVADDCMASFTELIHADLFADFLEMSEHLLDQGYKEAAAVLAGGVLEEHLRKLCIKNSISLVGTSGKNKTMDPLNIDLAKAAIYPKTKQQEITSWASYRNDAAHRNTGATYQANDVKRMIEGIRSFVSSYPA